MNTDQKNICGCDNGISGAITLLSSMGKIIDKMVMPIQRARKGNEIDILEVKRFLRNASPEHFIFVLEEPGGSKSAKAASSMAGSFHSLRTLAILMGYKFIRTTPQAWQKELLKCKAGDTKAAAKRLCHELWPEEDWRSTQRCTTENDGLHDSALIAEWARRSRL